MMKKSSCSIECDADFRKILNYITQQEQVKNKSMIDPWNNQDYKPKEMHSAFEVSISKSLRSFWEEEFKLSSFYFGKEKTKTTSIINYSDNAEG